MEKTITLKIEGQLNGFNVESILKSSVRLSRSMITKLKQLDNGIMLNGERAKTVTKVKNGDVLTINIPAKKSKWIAASDIPLDILYEDEDILAVNKPRSMPTHPSRRHPYETLANGVMHYYNSENAGFHSITRLDKDTSGIVLIAKNPFAAKLLSDEMKSGKIEKAYTAIVNGKPRPENGTVSAPIRKAENDGIRRLVSPDGKAAITVYKTEKSINGLSVVSLVPITGRTHQLRVHMSYINTPIYGDEMYGAPQKGEKSRLHCSRISFFHPIKKKKITLTAPLPDDMVSLSEGKIL